MTPSPDPRARSIGCGLLLCTLLCGVLAASGPEKLVIIDNGRTNYEIVLPRNELPTTRLAAEELQRYLQTATAVKLPIVRTPTRGRDALRLQTSDALAPHGFTIKTSGTDIVLTGRDSAGTKRTVDYLLPVHRGTCNAVYEFLERFVGVRWLWSDPLGEIVPPQVRIAVPASIDIAQAPAFEYRSFAYGPSGSRHGDWARRNRLGTSVSMNHGHNLNKLVPAAEWASRGHPEYSAMVDGTRRTKGSHLCTSNIDVARIAAEKINNAFDRNSRLYMASISLPDGRGFCSCQPCRALDVPGHVFQDRSRRTIMSDRILHFYNTVAGFVAQRHPERLLGGYIYSDYLLPPGRVTNVHPMVALVVAPNIAGQLWRAQKWEFCKNLNTTWGQLHNRVYAHDTPYLMSLQFGMPTPLGQPLVELVRLYAQVGLRGAYLYLGPTWESLGADGYVLARLLWDPNTNVERTKQLYFGLLYQSAAGAVRSYFDMAEECWKTAQTGDKDKERQLAKAFHRTRGASRKLASIVLGYSPMLARLEAVVIEAERLAAGDERVAKRVARLRDNFTLVATTIRGLNAVADFEFEKDPAKNRAALGVIAQSVAEREILLNRLAFGYGSDLVSRLRLVDKKIDSPLRPESFYCKQARGGR